MSDDAKQERLRRWAQSDHALQDILLHAFVKAHDTWALAAVTLAPSGPDSTYTLYVDDAEITVTRNPAQPKPARPAA